ncbi:hypothetical protein ACG83_30465 [Frankia sp. R43]|nr:hypothetical protein ACG83_30465 [Frankia sp. R43]
MWALWVAAVLEAEGQRVRVQAWDSPAGTNFVAWINEQMTLAARTVAICSDAYFASHWCTQEWTGALAGNTLTPLRVTDCAIPPVLATIAYRDLHGADEPTARRRLVEAVGLAVPARVSPGFPGGPTPVPVGAVFPGGPSGQGVAPAALVDPPTGAVRVINADPYRLGVHRAIHLPGAADETLPAYVDRDIDHQPVTGIRARLRTAAGRGGFVLLVGGSSAGKTRCAFEAIRAELGDWWLLRPTSPTQITTLAAAPPTRTVLWLDEIQTYLNGEHGLTATTVSALLDAPVPVVLVGTIWPERYRAFTTPPPPGTRDDHPPAPATTRTGGNATPCAKPPSSTSTASSPSPNRPAPVRPPGTRGSRPDSTTPTTDSPRPSPPPLPCSVTGPAPNPTPPTPGPLSPPPSTPHASASAPR